MKQSNALERHCELAEVPCARRYTGALQPGRLNRLCRGLAAVRLNRRGIHQQTILQQRRIAVFLSSEDNVVNRKRLQRLTRRMSAAPGPSTSGPQHRVYACRCTTRPSRGGTSCGARTSCVKLAHGFAYLVAVIDWYSRRVLSSGTAESASGCSLKFYQVDLR
jgi:putative transposase